MIKQTIFNSELNKIEEMEYDYKFNALDYLVANNRIIFVQDKKSKFMYDEYGNTHKAEFDDMDIYDGMMTVETASGETFYIFEDFV